MDMISGIRAQAAHGTEADASRRVARALLSERLLEEFTLTEKVAVVTGAASGIGRETAVVFAEAGADLVLADVEETGLAETEAMVTSKGARVKVISCDVGDRNSVNRLAVEAIKAFGRLDVWANVAGIISNSPVVEVTEDDLERITRVNQWGTFWGTAAAGRAMKSGGSIINVSSAGGEMPAPSLSVYAMTKAAVTQLTRCAAAELGPKNIRVNAIAPGFTDTSMVRRNWTRPDGTVDETVRNQLIEMRAAQSPMNITGEAIDQALAMLYLASNASKFVTGQVIRANGGTVMA